jgi:lipoate-protein ligase B
MRETEGEEHSLAEASLHRCQVFDLGLQEYQETLHLQKTLQQARIDGTIPESVLVLQHYPVITLGKSGNRDNVIATEELLAEKGIPVADSDRGGDVTFHNPGQLVAYLIFDLSCIYGRPYREVIYKYVRDVEEVVLRVLADFDLVGYRVPEHPGVWLRGSKVCGIGLNIRHGVSSHGLALNVNNDLRISSYIYSCGIRDATAISMSQALGRQLAVAEVLPFLLTHLSDIFSLSIERGVQRLPAAVALPCES